jgi:hypothetical protein
MTDDFVEHAEEELSWAGLALAETIRAGELAVIVLGSLLICPPLFILAAVVIVPTIILAVVVGAVAAVIAAPVFAIRHLHRHRSGSAHERVHRLARLGGHDSTVRRLAGKLHATP